jgi:hypothetical protein
VTAEELAAWGKASRAASGVPEKIEDPAVIARLVVLSDLGHDGGGSTAATHRRHHLNPTVAGREAQPSKRSGGS